MARSTPRTASTRPARTAESATAQPAPRRSVPVPPTRDPARLSALEAAAAIAAGKLTSETLVGACLERIAGREGTVGAWIHLDPELALSQARALDREPSRGPLHGVPIGIKDLFDTADQPSAYGSPIYAGNRPAGDAAAVAIARHAGMVILGKTVTTEFAHARPGKTANPLDPTRTPGGSSSGSAAAVADHHVPLATGTQTGGSVIRPASFCGIAGYKPTWGRISTAGVKPLSSTFDHVGLFGRAVDDIAVAAALLAGEDASLPDPARPPRIGLCRSPTWDSAKPETRAALESAARALEAAGATVREIRLPRIIYRVEDGQAVMNGWEARTLFAPERHQHGDLLSPQFRDWMIAAEDITELRYRTMRRDIEMARIAFDALFSDPEGGRRGRIDLLLTPAATGEAPRGLSATGDAAFNRLWTILHCPCVTLPHGAGPNGMPVGVQLVGPRFTDRGLFAFARWAEPVLTGRA